ncbi:MAG TPA: DUF1489 domain-containing protein [Caulobacteraceae bacterium]|nr:DUF1489 domain-containing protein [Caulobacteraceae bacterium]
MTLHLIKLCVGAATPEDLAAWRASRKAAGHRPIVHTRQTPKRADDILDGGSLYWVFRGVILIRQPVLAIETIGEGPQRRCEILLDEAMIPTAPHPRRAFQGWRYLEPKDAPADFGEAASGDFPPDLARRLREAGAW